MKSTRFSMAVLVATLGVYGLPVAAQQPGESAKPAPIGKREVQVYPLKHTSAVDVAAALNEFYGRPGRSPASFGPGGETREVRIAAEPRTNAVLVLGATAEIENIQKLIKALDVESADAGRRQQVHVIPLQHITPDADLQKALNVVLQGRSGGFAVDTARRQIVLSGDRETIESARLVLERLDAAPPPAAKSDLGELQVRVVWLVSGPAPEGAAKPPPDLAEVVAELAKLGIEKPWLAAQSIVNASPSSSFQLQGSAKLDTPCTLTITGMLGAKKQHPAGRVEESRTPPSLEIEIRAARESRPQRDRGGFGAPASAGLDQICNVRTQITTPLGHPVVLGVTPTEGMTSVFVVQVLRKEAKAKQ